MNLGAPEIVVILVLALLLFGGRKLPELGSSVGKTITNFRKGLAEAKDDEVISAGEQQPAAQPPPAPAPPAPAPAPESADKP